DQRLCGAVWGARGLGDAATRRNVSAWRLYRLGRDFPSVIDDRVAVESRRRGGVCATRNWPLGADSSAGWAVFRGTDRGRIARRVPKISSDSREFGPLP